MKLFYTTLLSMFAFAIFGQPLNDNCADATAIGEVEDLPFDNSLATTDGPLHIDSPCPGASELDSLYNDIWYLYTPTFTGTASFSLCGTADFDSKIAVYQSGAVCPVTDGDLLACNEDGPTCANGTSQVLFGVEAGESYLLRLAGFGEEPPGFSGQGTFSVNEFEPILENDFCADAIEIFLGADQEFTTVGATTDGPTHEGPCFLFDDNSIQSDIWFTYTATEDDTLIWSTCNTENSPMINFDSRLGVYVPGSSCPPTSEDLLACNDDGEICLEFTSELFFPVEAGNQYLLRMGGWTGTTGFGTFDLLSGSPEPPPANNLCADAEEVEINQPGESSSTSGTTMNANFDPDNFIAPLCQVGADGEYAEVWYKFNSEGYTQIDFALFSTTPGAQYFVDIWEDCSSGPIDTLQIINSCFEIEGEVFSTSIAPFPPDARDYIMRIGTRFTFTPTGDFEFQLTGVLTNVEDLEILSSPIVISPNPVNEQMAIDIPLLNSMRGNIKIFNVVGERVWNSSEINFNKGNNKQKIDVSGLETGVYFAQIQLGNGIKTLKFIKS